MSEQPDETTTSDAEAQVRFQHVSDELKLGFVALGSPALSEDAKPRWHQRLIAITNSAKHDLATAEKRLATFWTDWEAEVGPRP